MGVEGGAIPCGNSRGVFEDGYFDLLVACSDWHLVENRRKDELPMEELVASDGE